MLYIQFFRKDLSRPIVYYFRVRDFDSYAKALADIRADGLQAVNVYEFEEFKRFPDTFEEWRWDLSFNHASMRSAPKSLFPYINETVKPLLAAGIQDSLAMTGDALPSASLFEDPAPASLGQPEPNPVSLTPVHCVAPSTPTVPPLAYPPLPRDGI